MKRKILLLGHTGFLGKNLHEKLLIQNEYIVDAASKSSGVDLREWNQVDELFKVTKPDVVINCASYVGGIQFGLNNKGNIYEYNMLMHINVIRAIRKYRVLKNIHPISNCTYPGHKTVYDEDEWWDGPMHDTVDIYGYTKKAIGIASKALRAEGLDTVQLIFPNMYGPGDHLDPVRAHALGAILSRLAQAKKNNIGVVAIWGSGAPIREWLHVADAVDAILKFIECKTPEVPINISSGVGVSIKELAEKLRNIIDEKIMLEFDATKPDGALVKILKPSPFLKEINWFPSYQLERGLLEVVQAYKG